MEIHPKAVKIFLVVKRGDQQTHDAVCKVMSQERFKETSNNRACCVSVPSRATHYVIIYCKNVF